MTLHFSASLPKYSLQVSDRRVTRARGLRLEEFDPDANKTLLYLAPDAIVSMGYSGGAFVDGVPTDTWIAQTLTGVDSFVDGVPTDTWIAQTLTGVDSFVVGGVLAGFLGPVPRVMDIGQSAEWLRIELERVTPGMSRRRGFQPITIAIVGFRWTVRRPNVHQLLWEVRSDDAGRTFQIERRERRYPDASRLYFALTGDMHISDPHFREAGGVVAGFEQSPNDAENVLVAALRRRADVANGSIGKDCMSVGIAPPEGAAPSVVRVRYLPERRRPEEIDSEGRSLSATFSPWLLGPDSVAPPGVVAGTQEWWLGPVKVTIDAPELDAASPRLASFRPQPRPREP